MNPAQIQKLKEVGREAIGLLNQATRRISRIEDILRREADSVYASEFHVTVSRPVSLSPGRIRSAISNEERRSDQLKKWFYISLPDGKDALDVTARSRGLAVVEWVTDLNKDGTLVAAVGDREWSYNGELLTIRKGSR